MMFNSNSRTDGRTLLEAYRSDGDVESIDPRDVGVHNNVMDN